MNFPLHHSFNFLYNHFLQKIDNSLNTTFSKPIFIIFRLTEKCNSKCKMCSIIQRPYEGELSTEQIKKLITNLKEWLGPHILVFSGGEPTLRKDLWELIKYANEQKIRTTLLTNGSLITKRDIPLIMNSGLKDLKISLDTLDPKTYKKIRGKNFHKKVLQTIDLLKKHTKDISISILTVITKHNIDELSELVEFVKQKKLNSIALCPLSLINSDAKKELNYLWPNPKKIKSAIDKMIKYKKKGYPLSNSVKYLELIKKYYQTSGSINEKCKAPSIILRISAAGYTSICYKRIGCIMDKTPKEIWDSKETKQMRKELYNCKKNCAIMPCHTNNSIFTRIKQYKNLIRTDFSEVDHKV